MSSTMKAEITSKLLQYEAFVNDVLKEDLLELEKKLDKKTTDITEFLQLKSVICSLENIGAEKEGFKSKIDLGDGFFVQAKVEDVSYILLDVGLGLYVEFTLCEALEVIEVRVKIIERQVNNLRNEIAKTNAHIKMYLIGLRDLQGIRNFEEE
ncbi:protein UXT homolog [Copidosoma floridanum]|uniref:protein UXT homolog n=1 Tax=Copidosoma floridanum TaxID=29053 RepID=UPI0006C98598|nr:protein UXT homolog [Copidosoma floridanum]